MGSGASTEAAEKIKAASDAEVKDAVGSLSEEQKQKLRKALAGLQWQDCFVIFGHYACKDIPLLSQAALKDAAIQVKEEPRAPRFAVMGTATNESPPDDSKDNVFWLAEFECEDAWAGPEHKERENNKAFLADMMASGASAEEGMAGLPKDMAGSYTGPACHLEKQSTPSGEHDVFNWIVKAKAKDEDCAEKMLELIKGFYLLQELPQRVTIMRAKNMKGPIAKDDNDVYWIVGFKTKEDFAKQGEKMSELAPKMMELVAEAPKFYEFSATKFFHK